MRTASLHLTRVKDNMPINCVEKSETIKLTYKLPSRHMPSKQRKTNVKVTLTSMGRHDVALALIRRCFKVVGLLGWCMVASIHYPP